MNSRPRRRNGVYPQKVRCKATNRWGEQCRKWAMKGSVVCNKHGGAAPQVRRKAQERIMMAQDDAASLLVNFMADEAVPYAERRRAAEFLLTYESRNEVNVTIAKWQEGIDRVVIDVSDASEDVVDGEIIDDDQPPEVSGPGWQPRILPSLVDDPPLHPRGPRTRPS